MKPFEIVLYALLRLQPTPNPDWEESQAHYVQRLTTMAVAVSATTDSQHWQASVITLWKFESHFGPKIHGEVGTGDGGKANCMGQIHRLWKQKKAEWAAMAGTSLEATKRCAKATKRFLSGALWLCLKRDSKATMAEAFSLYGTGNSCTALEDRKARAKKLNKVLHWMRYPKPLPKR